MSFIEALNHGFPPLMWILLLVCALCSAVGFYKFVYFMSVGYGLSVSGVGVTLIFMYHDRITLAILLQCILLIVYGLRLSGFLLVREYKSLSYQKVLTETTQSEKPIPLFAKMTIWISVIALYVAQTSPVYYRLANNKTEGSIPWIAAIIMAIAIIIETTSDMQKSASKKVNPNHFCNTGLYKMVRCPNYLGEILFWTGVFVSGFSALEGILQWIIASLGYLLIVYVMFSGAKRLEIRQNKSYGNLKEYQAYVKKTPIMIPFIPLYSLKNWNFIK